MRTTAPPLRSASVGRLQAKRLVKALRSLGHRKTGSARTDSQRSVASGFTASRLHTCFSVTGVSWDPSPEWPPPRRAE